MQFLLGGQASLVGSSNDKLGVVNEAGVVRIHGTEHLLNLCVGHDPSVVLEVAGFDFHHVELAVTVGVESLEDLGQVVALRLAHQLRGDERESGLLEGNITLEAAQVIEGVHGEGLVDLKGSQLGDPWVLECSVG